MAVQIDSKFVVADDYMALIRRFPLRALRNKRDFQIAGEILDSYIGRPDLSPGELDYVDALAHFVIDYERRVTRDKFAKLSPIELLKSLMEAHHMNTTDLGHVLGTRGLASEVLNGKRGLSKALIAKLSRRFDVEPGLWISVKGETDVPSASIAKAE